MVPKFLFCVFTAGLSANFVAYATPHSSEVKGSSSVLELPQDEPYKKTKKSFLPLDFKVDLKGIGTKLEKVFGDKKLAAVFLSSLFSGLATYLAFKLIFKNGTVSKPLEEKCKKDEDSELKQNSEDVATDDKTYTDYIPGATLPDTNISASDDAKKEEKINKLSTDSERNVEKNLNGSMPHPIIGVVGLTVVLVCLLYYCYSVSNSSDLQESNSIDVNNGMLNVPEKSTKISEYGTLENPFYLFDGQEKEEDDKDLRDGENGKFDIKNVFMFTEKNLEAYYYVFNLDKRDANNYNNKDVPYLKRLKGLYFKISVKNLLKILGYSEKKKEEILQKLPSFKDGNDGNVNFYISDIFFGKDAQNRLGIVVFKDKKAGGMGGIIRKVLSDKNDNIKLKTKLFFNVYAFKDIEKFTGKSKVESDDDEIPPEEHVKVENLDFGLLY